jgi:hypothetical protein
VLDQRRDRDDRDILAAGEEHLRLVRNAEGVAPRADCLEHRRRVGGDHDLDLEPGIGEVAAILRDVDPGVVGIWIPVEGKRDLRAALGPGDRGEGRGYCQTGGNRRRATNNVPAADATA